MQLESHLLDERFQKAQELLAAESYERAHELLLECVKQDCSQPHYVAAYLTNLTRKFKAAHGGQIPPKPTELPPVAAPGTDNFLLLGLVRLADYPWQTRLIKLLTEAAAAHQDWEIASLLLQVGLEAEPRDVPLNRAAANLFAMRDMFPEAIAAWQQVEQLLPDDPEPPNILAQLAIWNSRLRSGWKSQPEQIPAVIPRGKSKPRLATVISAERMVEELALDLPPEDAGLKRTPIQRLEWAVREHPGNPIYYLHLAKLYVDKDRLPDAEKLLAKGRDATGDDDRVRRYWEELAMQRLERRIGEYTARLEHSDTPLNRAELTEAKQERDRLETRIFLKRCELEPQNLTLKYELGLRHKRAGKLSEASAAFREALQDPASQAAAAFELGEYYREAGDVPQALRYYRQAADSPLTNAHEAHKQALYQAGGLAARMKLTSLAQRYWNQLRQLDANYRDTEILLQECRRLEQAASS